MMWDCAMKKHEVYKISIIKIIIFLASKAKLPELRHLYDKVKETPLNHLDKWLVLLLKTLAKTLALSLDSDGGKRKRMEEILRDDGKKQKRRQSGELKHSEIS